MQRFIQFWKEKNATSSEGKMAQAYEMAVEELDRIRSELFKLIRPAKSGKGLVAVFDSQAERLIPAFESCEQRVTEIGSDISKFLELTGGDPSTNSLGAEKQRLKRGLDNAKLAVKNATLRQIKSNKASSAVEAEGSKEVMELLGKKERLEGEYGPKLKEVEKRLTKAREILAKYG